MIMSSEPPLLAMRGIDKSFPGVRALQAVDLELRAGEVLALMGENGAGKSTLIKILGGAFLPDAGEIRIEGRPVAIQDPVQAVRAGIAVIYQEFNLVPALSARENIFLGRERTTAGCIHRRDEHRRARELFERIGMAVDPEVPCRQLAVAQQQAVEIARAVSLNARILVMDEPTATLSPREVESLFAMIGDLKRQGIGVIYVSHRLDEVFAIADRVMVMRDGRHVATRPSADITREQLIELMVGRTLENEFPRRPAAGTVGWTSQSVRIMPDGLGSPSYSAPPRLVVRNLSRRGKVEDVSFDIRRGEIVALAGLVGAGRTETACLLFGADRPDAGTIELDGRLLRIRQPRDAIRAGICLLTEDRKSQGLVLGQSVLHNVSLPTLPRLSTAGVIHPRRERFAFDHAVRQLQIKVAHAGQPARQLSGGNQQKVVLAKWLQSNSEVIIFDEPTRGIDVGAKYEIYQSMNDLAAQGKAILMISSELPEVLGMADRILVMHAGRITGEITDVPHATQQQILDLAIR